MVIQVNWPCFSNFTISCRSHIGVTHCHQECGDTGHSRDRSCVHSTAKDKSQLWSKPSPHSPISLSYWTILRNQCQKAAMLLFVQSHSLPFVAVQICIAFPEDMERGMF